MPRYKNAIAGNSVDKNASGAQSVIRTLSEARAHMRTLWEKGYMSAHVMKQMSKKVVTAVEKLNQRKTIVALEELAV